MTRIPFRLVLLLGALLMGCRGVNQPPAELAGSVHTELETFQLPFGKVFVLADATEISFVELIAESRCPRQVVCVSAGEASIALNILHRGREMALRAAIPGGVTRVDSTRANPLRVSGFSIQLLQLDPYPLIPGATDPGEYVAHLRMGRLASQ